jgi:hypothetical protein
MATEWTADGQYFSVDRINKVDGDINDTDYVEVLKYLLIEID